MCEQILPNASKKPETNSTCRPATFYWRHWRLLATKLVEAVEFFVEIIMEWCLQDTKGSSRPLDASCSRSTGWSSMMLKLMNKSKPGGLQLGNGIFVPVSDSGSKVVIVLNAQMISIPFWFVGCILALHWLGAASISHIRTKMNKVMIYVLQCVHQCKTQACSTRTIEWIVPRCIAINNIIPSRWTMYVPFRLPLMPALVVNLRPLNKPRNAEKNLDQKIEGHDEYWTDIEEHCWQCQFMLTLRRLLRFPWDTMEFRWGGSKI